MSQKMQEFDSKDFEGVDLSDTNAVEAEKERLCRELRKLAVKSLEIAKETETVSKKLLRLQIEKHTGQE